MSDVTHTFLLVTAEGGKLSSSVLGQSSDPAAPHIVRSALQSVISAGTTKGAAGRPGRKVAVVGVSPEYTGPVAVGDIFDSAAAASKALGFEYNAVTQSLSTARLFGRGPSAVVRGVEVQYLDEISARE